MGHRAAGRRVRQIDTPRWHFLTGLSQNIDGVLTG